MTDSGKTYDVFVSHSAQDGRLAQEIADVCCANGLDAVTSGQLLVAANSGDALWEALAESRAVVAVLSESGLSPEMAIEIGGAQAWNKPIYGIVSNPTMTEVPPGLRGVRLYTLGRVDDVIRTIKRSGQELSAVDFSLLASLYSEIGVSVDQLALEPSHLKELVKSFNAASRKDMTGERLLSELLRMRKQGNLPKIRPGHRPKAQRGTG